MKVRHKVTGNEHFVIEQSDLFYILATAKGFGSCNWFAEKKTNCELVPEPTEQWRDVTSECEAFADTNFNGLMHRNLSRYQTTPWADGYRLRKVQLFQQNPLCPGSTGHSGACYEPITAFLVERKESHD